MCLPLGQNLHFHVIFTNSAIHQSGGSLTTGRSPYRRKNGHIPSIGEQPLGVVASGGLPAAGLVNSSVRMWPNNRLVIGNGDLLTRSSASHSTSDRLVETEAKDGVDQSPLIKMDLDHPTASNSAIHQSTGSRLLPGIIPVTPGALHP